MKLHPALDILKIPTAPRHEKLVLNFISSYLKNLKVPFRVDKHGNIVAHLKTSKSAHPIAFGAHTDHPGFGIKKISPNRVETLFLGGVPRDAFRKGVPVELFDRHGNAVAQTAIDRVLKWDRKKGKNILLKIKKGTAEHASFGMWKLPAFRIDAKRNRYISRACDDLAGCAAMLGALKLLIKQRARVNFYLIFTQREEIEFNAVYEVARSGLLPKSIPIVSIETSKMLPNALQGDGPIVRVGDRKSIFDPALTQTLCDAGKNLQDTKKVPFQRKLMDGGMCEATAYLWSGYKASGMCVALGNYHNYGIGGKIAPEYIHAGDWQGLVHLIAHTAKTIRS